MRQIKKELVMARRKDKVALFDCSNSKYLTRHKYDDIYISNCGKHICVLYADKDRTDGLSPEIIKKAYVVDNNGKHIKFDENIKICNIKTGFDDYGILCAKDADDNNILIDVNGKIIKTAEKDFSFCNITRLSENEFICFLNTDHSYSRDSNIFAKLFKFSFDKPIEVHGYFDNNGEDICIEEKKISSGNIDYLCELLEKHGFYMMFFANKKHFSKLENAFKMQEAIFKHFEDDPNIEFHDGDEISKIIKTLKFIEEKAMQHATVFLDNKKINHYTNLKINTENKMCYNAALKLQQNLIHFSKNKK